MIRIDLVDKTNSVKHVDFRVLPVIKKKDFTCIPPGIMPLRIVMRLSQKVQAGRVFGRLGKYLWYRWKDAPPGRHKSPMSDPQSGSKFQLPRKASRPGSCGGTQWRGTGGQ